MRVGESQQICRVLPSTAGQATYVVKEYQSSTFTNLYDRWVVTPGACPPGEPGAYPPLTCEESRGGLFDYTNSKSWDVLGNYSLGLEANLGYGGLSATYGDDTLALGFAASNGGPKLKSQVVAGIETPSYYVGVFGLGSQGTNLTSFNDTHPSFLTTMKAKNLIPSLSWAYTAGAPYSKLSSVYTYFACKAVKRMVNGAHMR